MSIGSFISTVNATGSVISTKNVRFLPFYHDDPEASKQALQKAFRGWKHDFEKWKQGKGRTYPAPLPRVPAIGGKYAYLKKIWKWIPDLNLYGKRHIKSCVEYLDRARIQLSGLMLPETPVVSEAMLRATRNLWEHRPISQVLNKDMTEALFNQNGFAVAPHLGNCTDVVIGMARIQPNGIEDLLAAYRLRRMNESAMNDLFDLSVLSGLIVAHKESGRRLKLFSSVKSDNLSKLVPSQDVSSKGIAMGNSIAAERKYLSDRKIPDPIPPVPWFPSIFAGPAKGPQGMSDDELLRIQAKLKNLVKAMRSREFVPPNPNDFKEAQVRLQAFETEIARRKIKMHS